jgi:DNA-binding transcriptional ArsR family regulator
MGSELDLAWIASVVGDPARSRILLALMDGRARTAKELAFLAGIAAPTASGHLAKLLDGRLVAVEPQGRHRYYRLASALVAQLLETMAVVGGEAYAPDPRLRRVDPALAAARTCYDHLAGRLGVALADALVAGGYAELASDAGVVTDAGIALLGRVGIDVEALMARRGRRATRVLCRPCLDWSERRPHLAGAVGAALCAHSFSKGWIRRIEGTRAVTITAKGERIFHEAFGVELR